MRTPILPALMLLAAAAALYFLPDGALRSWRLATQGALARLFRTPPEEAKPDKISDHDLLEDLLERLSQKDAEIAGLRQQLRDIGQTREAVQKLRIVKCKIIKLGPSGEIDTFTIDAGFEEGVAVGDAVVVGQSLLGVVAKAGPNASLALSLSSPGFYLSARLTPSEISETVKPRELCAIRGSGKGMVKAITFSSETTAKLGWLAFTSGLEKGVPEGLIIGEVAGTFTEGKENGTLEAPLRPKADLQAVDWVMVMQRQNNTR